MTQEALYHQNGTQLEFDSTVVACNKQELAEEVALSATAFYPEGGGQRGDAGVLRWNRGEVQVTDTRKDKATGTVWHAVNGELPPVGTLVAGRVDGARRWRHMQRHSAEHLLAQAFKRVNPAFGVAAVSMNSPECHLDLHGHPQDGDVRAAETLLREVLGRDELTLSTPVVPEAELSRYPLRRETKITGQVRLVIFSDQHGEFFDVSACGGTHVPRAAMCSPVVVLRTERIKDGLTRVTFMAGEEAADYLSSVYRDAKALAQGFSVPVNQLSERVQALYTEKDTLKHELGRVRAELARMLVQRSVPDMLRGVQPIHFLELEEDALLQPVLTSVESGQVIVALAPSGRCGIASGKPAFHAGNLLREALNVTGGKGGGKVDLAQGTTLDPQEFFGVVRMHLKTL